MIQLWHGYPSILIDLVYLPDDFIAKPLASPLLFDLFRDQVPVECVAVVICEYQAFVVELLVVLVQDGLEYLG
jgi:hypothetical protein